MKYLLYAGLAATLGAAPSLARPVSYEGGTTAITENAQNMNALWVHYTPDPKWSLGVRLEADHNRDIRFAGGQATRLVNRWFGEDYQGNLYAFGGAGLAEGFNGNALDASAAGFVGAMADWETRRLFTSYSVRTMAVDGADTMTMQAARVGVAPYIGEYGDLHTWVMLQVSHENDADDRVEFTPLLRFFKGPVLAEFGYNVTAEAPLFNLQFRF